MFLGYTAREADQNNNYAEQDGNTVEKLLARLQNDSATKEWHRHPHHEPTQGAAGRKQTSDTTQQPMHPSQELSDTDETRTQPHTPQTRTRKGEEKADSVQSPTHSEP